MAKPLTDKDIKDFSEAADFIKRMQVFLDESFKFGTFNEEENKKILKMYKSKLPAHVDNIMIIWSKL